MSASEHGLRILVLADAAGAAASVMSLLEGRGNLRVVNTADEAVAELRTNEYDLVIAGGSELLPLTRIARHERAGHVLENIGQGVCIVARGGRVIWANSAMRAYPSAVADAVRTACAAAAQQWSRESSGQRTTCALQQELRVGQEYVLDLSISALPAGDGSVEDVFALFADVTAMSRMRERLDAIDAAGRELVAINVDEAAELDVGERLRLLEEKVIRYCGDLLNFTHFAIMVLDPQTGHLDQVVSKGFSEKAQEINIYAKEEGNGISGYVAATGRSYICPDITHDPLYLPGLECAASSLAVPLRLLNRVVGVMNVESDKPAAFTDEDRQVAEIFARYVAVALHTLKLLVVQRSEAAGQVSADVCAEMAEPLDGIVAEVSRLIDQNPGPDELRRRLGAVIRQVDEAKKVLQQATKPLPIRGLVPEASVIDPILKDKRVLVADDEDIIRDTIADLLNKAGALAVTARDGDEAVAMVRAQQFNLVLSDIKMPNKSGYEVFAAARAANSDCPVILITGFGYDPEHSIVRASREGLAAVLFKPFKVEQLIEQIHKALGAEPSGNQLPK